MDALGRLLVVVLVFAPVAGAVWLLLVSWVLAVLALAAGSAGILALGSVAARRDARDAYWRTRRCASCGLRVPDRATVCPSCHSAALVGAGQAPHLLERDRPAEQRRQERAAAARQGDAERRNRELGLLAVPFRYFGRYVAFLQAGFDLDPGDPTEMRWWAATLLLLAGLFATVGVAT